MEDEVRRGEEERGRSQSYKYNMLYGMEQDPLQKDKKRDQGGGSHSVSSSQITLWPLDDTSHQQSAA